MATVYIRVGGAMGNDAPIINTVPRATATVTSTATSQNAGIVAKGGEFLRMSAVGNAIRYAIGAEAPAALAGAGDWVLDGQTVDAGPLREGDQITIIDAS